MQESLEVVLNKDVRNDSDRDVNTFSGNDIDIDGDRDLITNGMMM